MSATSSESPDLLDRVQALIGAGQSDTITSVRLNELEQLLRQSEDAQLLYLELIAMSLCLPRALAGTAACEGAGSGHAMTDDGFSVNAAGNGDSIRQPSCPLPPVSLLSTALRSTVGYFSSGWPVAYLAATVIFGVGLAIGSLVHVSQPVQVARQPSAPSRLDVEPKMEPVGRITGMVACRWADPATEASNGAHVPLGRKYALASGLMEISYNTGAKVILQGPVTYEVESTSGGFLSIGKLTARMDKKTDGCGTMNDELRTRASGIHHSSFITHPLFAVRTPTAIVTDLGTEFGVEVDKRGATTSHVFRGSVTLQVVAADGEPEGAAHVLHEDESACTDPGKDQKLVLRLHKATRDIFVHRLPQRVPITVFNTGVGMAEGQPDLHWQIVAVSNEPKFQPRPATVSRIYPREWWPNDPGRSQWISIVGDASDLPHGITYTFRTTFHLTEVRPEWAVLRGWFNVDNGLVAMRLNGKEAPVPKHNWGDHNLSHQFTVTRGFVAGVNVLEMDVYNGHPNSQSGVSAMGLRVELEGSAVQE